MDYEYKIEYDGTIFEFQTSDVSRAPDRESGSWDEIGMCVVIM